VADHKEKSILIKNVAYVHLRLKLSEIDPEATKEAVVKKKKFTTKLFSERTQSQGFSKFICERLFRLRNQAFEHFDVVLFFLVFDLKANARVVKR
jgi:hypothetical protein